MVLVEEVLGKLPTIHDAHILALEEEIRKIVGYCEKLEEEWRIGKITDKFMKRLKTNTKLNLLNYMMNIKRRLHKPFVLYIIPIYFEE
ncbi:hypothetical protein KEJ17_04140 [Candidatus Bathyarchaeota archaeon]|nr:hypothetical protein [Candidatus Bathyarchaeota archaeon]